MESKVIKIEEISKLVIPPGEYKGTWSGYEVIINGAWRLTTTEGVRGTILCTVTASEDGSVYVTDKL